MNLPLQRYYRFMFLPGLLLFLVPSILHAYLLGPLPGSQDMEAMETAYILEKALPYCLVIGGLLMLGPILSWILGGSLRQKLGGVFFVVFLGSVTYLTNVRMSAEKAFMEPKTTAFAEPSSSKVPLGALVVGVEHNGAAKAYPLQYIGYHHKVQDSIGGMPVLVTYCVMCRTAMVYNPIVDGKYQTFRLVGMRNYNAILEDASTGTWWYQTTGEGAAGPKKGAKLQPIPYEQMTLKAWIDRYPNTLIMQPDPSFIDVYKSFEIYDHARQVEKDSATGKVVRWNFASWVVGVDVDGAARAYEWVDLLEKRVVNDQVGKTPVVVALESDTTNFHVWKRTVDGAALEFTADPSGNGMRDKESNSLWNWKGECVEGAHAGRKLEAVPAQQQYWHAWRNFHKGTTRWGE